MAELFTLTDLAAWLQTPEDELDGPLAELIRARTTALVAGEIRIPAAVPAGLSAVAVSIAARLYDNPLGYTAESFAGYSASYANASLTADEKAAIVAAVPLSGGVRGRATSSRMVYTSGWS